MRPRIAVDCMGGDLGPTSVVSGAILARRELDVELLLVGREEAVREALETHGQQPADWTLVHAEDVVEMDEAVAAALRRKRRSSLRIGSQLVRDGQADGFVSAGNTGAVMATAKVVLGTLTGVDRPALAAVVPRVGGHVVWLDVGANVNCKPEQLLQFAIMGQLYYRTLLGSEQPRVGLLSIGEEEGKGNVESRLAFKLLREGPFEFVGNVEGRDLFSGRADVVVCDGFVGNVALKAVESVVEVAGQFLKTEVEQSWMAKLGMLAARPALRRFRRRLEVDEYGGVPLLGVRGGVVICHGRSSPKALASAVRVASEYHRGSVNDHIERELAAVATAMAEGRRAMDGA